MIVKNYCMRYNYGVCMHWNHLRRRALSCLFPAGSPIPIFQTLIAKMSLVHRQLRPPLWIPSPDVILISSTKQNIMIKTLTAYEMKNNRMKDLSTVFTASCCIICLAYRLCFLKPYDIHIAGFARRPTVLKHQGSISTHPTCFHVYSRVNATARFRSSVIGTSFSSQSRKGN